jgi:hypothetical protein
LYVLNAFCVLLDMRRNSIDGRQHAGTPATAWLSKHGRRHPVLYCFYRKYATALSIRPVLIKIKYQKEICLDNHREQGVGHSYSKGFMVKYDESVKNAVCVFPHYTQRSTICTKNHKGDTLHMGIFALISPIKDAEDEEESPNSNLRHHNLIKQ